MFEATTTGVELVDASRDADGPILVLGPAAGAAAELAGTSRTGLSVGCTGEVGVGSGCMKLADREAKEGDGDVPGLAGDIGT